MENMPEDNIYKVKRYYIQEIKNLIHKLGGKMELSTINLRCDEKPYVDVNFELKGKFKFEKDELLEYIKTLKKVK